MFIFQLFFSLLFDVESKNVKIFFFFFSIDCVSGSLLGFSCDEFSPPSALEGKNEYVKGKKKDPRHNLQHHP